MTCSISYLLKKKQTKRILHQHRGVVIPKHELKIKSGNLFTQLKPETMIRSWTLHPPTTGTTSQRTVNLQQSNPHLGWSAPCPWDHQSDHWQRVRWSCTCRRRGWGCASRWQREPSRCPWWTSPGSPGATGSLKVSRWMVESANSYHYIEGLIYTVIKAVPTDSVDALL